MKKRTWNIERPSYVGSPPFKATLTIEHDESWEIDPKDMLVLVASGLMEVGWKTSVILSQDPPTEL